MAAALESQEGGAAAQRRRAWRRFRRHKLALVSAVLMILLIFVAFPLAPVVAPIHPHRIEIKEIGLAPGEEGHLLGTDLTGRDVWSRVVYGGRVSMSVGIVAVALFVTIGTILGSVSGYYGGRVDSLIMRITDTFMAFPTLIILITIVSFIGPGIFNSMLAIGLIGWTGVCRLVRSLILSIRETDYIMAAQAVGVEERWIIIRHILPNVVAPITVAASFGIAGAILTEAGLSFLGLGVQVPTPSWGNMLNEAQNIQIIENMPWFWVPPGLMITICVLAINFIGDGLRDALDHRMSLD
ncbi:MAG: ABC transporter permease [Caldilineaceae bacterium SB0665_bin_25]|nr:ABC transporter permease [Caldilineaceae bacterium SB0665_bin_25]